MPNCPLCGEDAFDMAGHLMVAHSRERRPGDDVTLGYHVFQCPCGRVYDDAGSLDSHLWWVDRMEGGFEQHVFVETLRRQHG
jgi:hypothetical protein